MWTLARLEPKKLSTMQAFGTYFVGASYMRRHMEGLLDFSARSMRFFNRNMQWRKVQEKSIHSDFLPRCKCEATLERASRLSARSLNEVVKVKGLSLKYRDEIEQWEQPQVPQSQLWLA